MLSKISELRQLLKKISPSPYANCIAGNSEIKYIPKRGYLLFAGGIQPYTEGSFEEIKERIQQEIELEEHGNWGER